MLISLGDDPSAGPGSRSGRRSDQILILHPPDAVERAVRHWANDGRKGGRDSGGLMNRSAADGLKPRHYLLRRLLKSPQARKVKTTRHRLPIDITPKSPRIRRLE